MATNVFHGDARAVAQVNNVTPANVEIADVFTIVLTDHNGKTGTIAFTASAATVQNAVEGLQTAAAAAKTGGEVPWNAVTVTEDDTKVIITADTAGKPFTVTATAVNGGAGDTQTLTDAASTACGGPYLYSDADNWSLRAIPVATNDVIVPATATGYIYGYDASAVALNSFTIEDGCSAVIGAPDKTLQIDLADSKNYYLGGTGETHLSITGATATVRVTQAGAGSGTGTFGLNLTTGEAGQTIIVECKSAGEKVGIAARGGTTMTAPTVRVMGGDVKIGAGTTLTTLYTSGGNVVDEAAVTTYTTEKAGTASLGKIATVTTLNVGKGTRFYYDSSGTATAVHGQGIIDASRVYVARTWTDTDLYAGSRLIDPYKSITHTNAITLNRCGFEVLDKGTNLNTTIAAAS